MQMKIGFVGFGVGIPKTNLQISAANIAKLYLRHGLHDNHIVKLGVHDLISVGGKSGAFLFTGFKTNWFELDPNNDGWTHNPISLVGKKIQIELHGVVAMRGSVDVVVTIFDKYNQGKELVNQCCVSAEAGFQFSEAKVMGIIYKSEI